MARKDVGLVMCPVWDVGRPQLGIALLKSHLNQRGHSAFSYDFANRLYKAAQEPYAEAIKHVDSSLCSAAFVRRMFDDNRAVVERCIEELLDSGAAVFGFSLYFCTRQSTLEFIRRLKERDPSRLVVVGGPDCVSVKAHPSGLNDWSAFAIADAVVPGEGETPLAALMAGMKDGRFSPAPGAFIKTQDGFAWGGDGAPMDDLDSLPFPDFSDCPPADYIWPNALVTYMTRGCIRKCAFCDVEFHWGGYRSRSGKRVFEEISHQLARHPGVDHFWFCDSIINADMKELGDLCDRLILARDEGMPGVRWDAYAIIRGDMTPPFLAKMARAGCESLLIGIESGSQRVLDSMKKGCRVQTAERVLRDIHAAGIKTTALMMVGFPTETRDDFRQSLEFMRRVAPYVAQVSPSESMTYIGEGTPLIRQAEDVFGIDMRTFHFDYWRTKDGANDYPERVRRYEEFCLEMERLRIPIAFSRERFAAMKSRNLAAYRQFLNQPR